MKYFFPLLILSFFTFHFSFARIVSPDTTACDALTSFSVDSITNFGVKFNFKVNASKANPQKIVYETRTEFGAWHTVDSFSATKDTSFVYYNLLQCETNYVRVRALCSNLQPKNWKEVSVITYSQCATACKKVDNLYSYGYSPTEEQISWSYKPNQVPQETQVRVEYKLATEINAAWLRDSAYGSPVILKNLKPNTSYIARTITVCNFQYDTSQTIRFRTICEAPSQLVATVKNETQVNFTWRNGLGSAKNKVLVVASQESGFRSYYYPTDSTFSVKDLQPCKTYTAGIYTDCDSGGTSGSDLITFTLNGCTTCTKVTNASSSIANNVTLINWNAAGVGKYIIEYKTADTIKNWTKDSSLINTYSLYKANDFYNYSVRIISFCNGKPDTSAIFKLTGVCFAPTNFQSNLKSASNVELTWQNASIVNNNFVVKISSTDNKFQKTYTVKGASLIATDLPTCTDFTAYLYAQCDAYNRSDYPLTTTFRTQGCSNCKANFLSFKFSDNNTIKGTWSEAGDKKYIVQYKQDISSVTEWTYGFFATNNYTSFYIQDRNLSYSYLARVITLCNNKYDTSAVVRIDNGCIGPNYINANVTNDSVVNITWSKAYNGTVNDFVVLIRASGGGFSQTFNVTGTSLILTNLPLCTYYFVDVYTKCDSLNFGFTDYGGTSFQINGCPKCKKVPYLDANSATYYNTDMRIYWESAGENNYILEYKNIDSLSGKWNRIDSITTTSYIISNLAVKQTYFIRVISKCNNQLDTSDIFRFTSNCPQPSNFVAKVVNDTIVKMTWQTLAPKNSAFKVIFNSDDYNIIRSYTTTDSFLTVTDLPKCKPYSATLVSGCSSYTNSSNYSNILIKGCTTCKVTQLSFAGSDSTSGYGNWSSSGDGKYYIEYKVDSDTAKFWKKDSVNYTFISLKNLVAYASYQVRVLSTCNGKLDTSDIVKFKTACPPPRNLSLKTLNETTATFTWLNALGTSGSSVLTSNIYDANDRLLSTSLVNGNSTVIENLTKCTLYHIELIESGCGQNVGKSSADRVYFKTLGCTNCQKPTNFSVYSIAANSATFIWFTTTGDNRYEIEYKLDRNTDTNWKKVPVNTGIGSGSLNELNFTTSYVARLISYCNNTSDTSAIINFKTLCPFISTLSSEVSSDTIVTFKWQAFDNANTQYSIKVFANNGQNPIPLIKTYTTYNNGTLVVKDLPKCSYYYASIIALCDSGRVEGAGSYFSDFTVSGCNNCAKLKQPTATNVSETSAQISWDPVGTLKYYIEYKLDVATEKNWTKDSTNNAFYLLGNLSAYSRYAVRVINFCDGKYDTSAVLKFTTLCPSPNSFSAYANSDTSAAFSWYMGTSGFSSFVIDIFGTKNNFKKSFVVSGNSAIIKDLPRCDTYTAAISTLCDSTTKVNAYNQSAVFTLYGCPGCTKITQLSFTAIDSKTIQGNWNEAGSDPGVRNYIILYKPSASNIWFSDSTKNNFISLNKLVAACTSYDVRVISICQKPSQAFYYVYDTSALVKVTTLCDYVCSSPYGVRANVKDSSATIYWWKNPLKNVRLEYFIDSNIVNQSGQPFSLTDTFLVLTNLKPCTNFIVRLHADCDYGNPNWLYYRFKTTGTCATPTTCVPVQNISYISSNDTTTITWNKYSITLTSSPKFEIQYRLSSDSAWSLSLQTTNESVFLKGLAYCKEYTVRIRAVCNATTSSAWTEYKFKAGNNCFRYGGSSNLKGNTVGGVLVSPNPGSTTATVQFQLAQAGNISIKILNAIGSEVMNIPLGNLDFGVYKQNLENIGALTPGLYLISVKADGDVPVTTRWMKL